jgi:hypothetical protein
MGESNASHNAASLPSGNGTIADWDNLKDTLRFELFLSLPPSFLGSPMCTSSIAGDTFTGQLITCCVVVAFVCGFLLREWVNQNAPQDFGAPEPLPPLLEHRAGPVDRPAVPRHEDRHVEALPGLDSGAAQVNETEESDEARRQRLGQLAMAMARMNEEADEMRSKRAAVAKKAAAYIPQSGGERRNMLEADAAHRFADYLERHDHSHCFYFAVYAEQHAPNDADSLVVFHKLFLSPSASLCVQLDGPLQADFTRALDTDRDLELAFKLFRELVDVSARNLGREHGLAFLAMEFRRQGRDDRSAHEGGAHVFPSGTAESSSDTLRIPSSQSAGTSMGLSDRADAGLSRQREEMDGFATSTASSSRGVDSREDIDPPADFRRHNDDGDTACLRDTEYEPIGPAHLPAETPADAAQDDTELEDAAPQVDVEIVEEEDDDDDDNDNDMDDDDFGPNAGIDVGDEDGERLDDIDGIMEAVGMKGRYVLVPPYKTLCAAAELFSSSLLTLLQSLALMVLLISLILGASVFTPYVIGRVIVSVSLDLCLLVIRTVSLSAFCVSPLFSSCAPRPSWSFVSWSENSAATPASSAVFSDQSPSFHQSTPRRLLNGTSWWHRPSRLGFATSSPGLQPKFRYTRTLVRCFRD